jgi:hypothetical protein
VTDGKIKLTGTKLPDQITDGPEDTEQAAFVWENDPPLIKSDAVDLEPNKAWAAAPAKRREYGYRVTLAPGTLCPHCSRPLRVTAIRHIDESGFDIICESCHGDIIRAERR